MPFEDGDASTKEAHCVADSDPVEDAVHRVKRILDAKCDEADIEKIREEQAELDKQQREQLVVCMCVNCPPVPNDGTSNQCACSTERPSISGYIPTMVRMQEFGSLPVWQAGFNQQPSCSILPPGFAP